MRLTRGGVLVLLPLVVLSRCASPGAADRPVADPSPSCAEPSALDRIRASSPEEASSAPRSSAAAVRRPTDDSAQAVVEAVADTVEALPEADRSVGGLEVGMKRRTVTVWWVGAPPSSLETLVSDRPYGVEIEVRPALHPRRLLDSVAGSIVQDGIDGCGPAVSAAGADIDGSGVHVTVVVDEGESEGAVVSSVADRIVARYGTGLGIHVEAGGGAIGT